MLHDATGYSPYIGIVEHWMHRKGENPLGRRFADGEITFTVIQVLKTGLQMQGDRVINA